MVKKQKKDDLETLQSLKDYVALATVNAEKYQKMNIKIIKSFTDKKIPGVYVTLSKPVVTVKKLLEEAGVDTRIVIFIDAITKTIDGTEKKDNCLFIGTPENLSDISIAMDQAVTALPAQKFIFFDSLSVLLVYNQPALVAKFIHLIAGKMHIWKVKGIIISLRRKEDEELIKELFQFCDIKIDL
ncbi:MAG: ATPase domain-containing protein [archaeon]